MVRALALGAADDPVAVIIVPVTLQIFSRFTDLIPPYIWTEELARFLLVWMVMIGAMMGVRESDALRRRHLSALAGRTEAVVDLAGRRLRAGVRVGLPVVGMGVHRLRLVTASANSPNCRLWTDPHRLADRRRSPGSLFLGEHMLDDARRHPAPRRFGMERRMMGGDAPRRRRGRRDPVRRVLRPDGAARAGGLLARPRLPADPADRAEPFADDAAAARPSTPTTPSSCWRCPSSC